MRSFPHPNYRKLPILIALLFVHSADTQPAVPGTAPVTPRIDLGLQPTPVIVPEAFDHLPDNLTVNLPPGFSARVFAPSESFKRLRFMAFDDQQVLHVADMDDDEILALPDHDGDGVADTAIVVASGFSRPHSIAFHGGDLYVADRPEIFRFRDKDADGIYEIREKLADLPSSGSHSTRTIVIHEQRQKMYVGVGWPCDLCEVSDPERGTILEFDLDGSGRRIYASGVRNVVGMTVDPRTGELWGTNNGHDHEGVSSPPEWIDRIRDGNFYGIPFAYGYRKYVDFSYSAYRAHLPLSAADSALVETMQPPAALLPAHTAPMGILFYDHDSFPERYRHAAFVALHAGHAYLAPIPGYEVVALFVDPDGSHARVASFLSGFQTDTEVSDVWGFPMGLATDNHGRLYVTSDRKNKVVLRVEAGPLIASWDRAPADSISAGALLSLDAIVRVERAGGEQPVELEADLSALGGPQAVPLEALEDGRHQLTFRGIAATGVSGLQTVFVRVRQGNHQIRVEHRIAVLPDRPRTDVVVYEEGLAAGWDADIRTAFDDLSEDLDQGQTVFHGKRAASFHGTGDDWDWVVRFKPDLPIDAVGLKAVHFAFHPGTTSGDRPRLNFYTTGTLIDLLSEGYVDLARKEWQVVKIPLHRFGEREPIRELTLGGYFRGVFFIDDLKLVGGVMMTVVEETSASTPASFNLYQNYPNPFNSSTVIPFSLSTSARVLLGIYNLAGQRVATPVNGEFLPAGPHRVLWDDAGRGDLASGVYIYRLSVEGMRQTRKLIFLR
ncbi:MAG: PQQ-dependent sugar dehydrogenase [Candidatus Latescibacterota bacterium]|nr:PQQ-dependent sugar dehydrogenase [Candidatus Latescibacterota bacterium]